MKSTADGLVDFDDLKEIIADHPDDIAAMMMTNPNTLGLFERDIPAITKLVHDAGGLMYYDGANLNPMLGVADPADMGFDVMPKSSQDILYAPWRWRSRLRSGGRQRGPRAIPA